MAEWTMVYKCRMCGKEVISNYPFRYVKGLTCSLDELIEREQNDVMIHKCSVRKIGLADFIGAKIERK